MAVKTRREFLKRGVAAGTVMLNSRWAMATPLGLPVGLQLYSVRDQLAKDYAGTLKQVAAIGYKEVEAAGFFDHTPQQVNAAMHDAGLSLVSAHYPSSALQQKLDQIIDFGRAVGLHYLICSFPGFHNPARVENMSSRELLSQFTLDDYRWNADRFNEWGRRVKAAGMRFGYHNHTMEFAVQNGVVPFDEMVRLTDPSLVTFEMDCGWVVVGGGDPVAYLERFPTRISMLHVKDFKPVSRPVSGAEPPPAAEMGRGTQDYRRIFEAARRTGNIRHCFVEQEAFNLPPMESLRIDAEYMENLKL